MENKPIHQHDSEWLEALAGKRGGQGARLHRALQEIEQDKPIREDMTHDWERLRFTIRREQASRNNSARIGYFALAASVLIVLGALRMMIPTDEPASRLEQVATMRGKAEQLVMSDYPKQDADKMEAALRRLGVEVKRQDEGGRVRLEVTSPQSDEVRALLEARAIPAPQQGALVIVFIPRP